MNRRRMMMNNKKPVYIFREGSSAFENTAGAAELTGAGFQNGYIYLDGRIGNYAGSDNQYISYGKIKVPVDFLKHKKLCIEAKSSGNVSSAVGYGKEYDMRFDVSRFPETYSVVSTERNVYKFDISKIDDIRYICAGITKVNRDTMEALKIYNIWLE